MNRRKFLQTLGIGTGAAALGVKSTKAAPELPVMTSGYCQVGPHAATEGAVTTSTGAIRLSGGLQSVPFKLHTGGIIHAGRP